MRRKRVASDCGGAQVAKPTLLVFSRNANHRPENQPRQALDARRDNWALGLLGLWPPNPNPPSYFGIVLRGDGVASVSLRRGKGDGCWVPRDACLSNGSGDSDGNGTATRRRGGDAPSPSSPPFPICARRLRSRNTNYSGESVLGLEYRQPKHTHLWYSHLDVAQCGLSAARTELAGAG